MGETPASRPGREERGPEGSPAFIPHGLPLWGESFRAPVTGGPKWKWGVRKVSRLVGEGEERDIPSQTAGWTEPRYRVKGQGLGGKLGAWSCSLGAQMGSLPDKRVQGWAAGNEGGAGKAEAWFKTPQGCRPDSSGTPATPASVPCRHAPASEPVRSRSLCLEPSSPHFLPGLATSRLVREALPLSLPGCFLCTVFASTWRTHYLPA